VSCKPTQLLFNFPRFSVYIPVCICTSLRSPTASYAVLRAVLCVLQGPIVAEAIFLNREELPVYPVYYDPVHDFGFLRFDPSKLQFMQVRRCCTCACRFVCFSQPFSAGNVQLHGRQLEGAVHAGGTVAQQHQDQGP
jgi:hypothetical protein